jgi:hypothetical protein
MPAHRDHLLRLGPPILVQIGWWTCVLLDTETRLERFTEPTPFVGQYFYISITMLLFGSPVAGAAAEGGGTTAFPVSY